MLDLGVRLSEIARGIPENASLIDVGCDHGRLPVSLLLSGRIAHAVAADVNALPLEKARQLASDYRIGAERFDSVLSDGLSSVGNVSGKTIVIAGMGGLRISHILRNSQSRLPTVARLVLQPNTETMTVRRCLMDIGFTIVDETMCSERSKRYTIIVAEPRSDQTMCSDQELFLGPVLMKRRDELFEAHCTERLSFLVGLKAKLGDRFPAEREIQRQWLSNYLY